MRVDVFLQYYKPHVSGLTNMAADIAEYLASQNFDIHVHSVAQTTEVSSKEIKGVTAHYYPKSFSIGRASFSLDIVKQIWRMRKVGGVAHVHLPYPEVFFLALILKPCWKILATYHCDAPRVGVFGHLVASLLDFSHWTLRHKSLFTVFSSRDYFQNSRARKWIPPERVRVIPVTSRSRSGGVPKYRIPAKKTVGFIGRPTHEKGIDVLLDALDALDGNEVVLLFAGPDSNLSEEPRFDKTLFKRLEEKGALVQLGYIPDDELRHFYASLDVFVFPSTNALEAFGIVQVEAMSAEVPVIASDLPGVRVLVNETGFGEVVKPGDSQSLAEKIMSVSKGQYDSKRAAEVLSNLYRHPIPVSSYEKLFNEISSR